MRYTNLRSVWLWLCPILILDLRLLIASGLGMPQSFRVLSRTPASIGIPRSTTAFQDFDLHTMPSHYRESSQLSANLGLQPNTVTGARDSPVIMRSTQIANSDGPRKRMYRYSVENRLRLIGLETMAIVVPLDLAAAELERFYHSVLLQVATIWSLQPPINPVLFTCGRLKLSMVSSNGAIPWAVVADIARALLEESRSYFTPVFRSHWQTEDHSTTLRIVFELLPTPMKR